MRKSDPLRLNDRPKSTQTYYKSQSLGFWDPGLHPLTTLRVDQKEVVLQFDNLENSSGVSYREDERQPKSSDFYIIQSYPIVKQHRTLQR